jgi:thioredoxin reductase (NADPH)
MEQMQKQSLLVGTEIINNHVEKVELHGDIKKIYLDNGEAISSKAVIICTGAQARWLNIENEKKLQGRGLSACATCDGFFFKDKVVAVIGGGNTAAEEALFLSKFATKVLVIHRRDKLRAEKILQERLSNNKKIDFLWNSEVKRYYGDSGLTAIDIFDNKKNETFKIDIDGVFVAIGHDPATSLFNGQINMDDNGYILTKPDSTQTSVDGVFAAGDVKDKIFRQAVTAAGMGCMAALEVEKYLE